MARAKLACVAGSGYNIVHALLLALTAALLAFAVALCATPAVRLAALRRGMVDLPGPRSSHARATPRGGGLAVAAALGVTLAVLAAAELSRAEAAAVAGCAAAFALLGLADDRAPLPARWRLAAQAVAAGALVAVTGGFDRLPLPAPLDFSTGALGAGAAALWIVAVANFYNFLDGIDGLAALQGLVTGAGIALMAWDPFAAACAAALAGGCAAFLCFNWPPARIFLGDVGSLLLGFAFAALPLLAPPADRPRALFFVAVSLWLFLSDAVLTLLRRLLRGAPVTEPHREHLYQRLVRAGASHRAVTLGLGTGAAVLTAAAAAAWRGGPGAAFAALGLAVSLSVGEWALVRARERRVAAS
jgi:Fuc2NAc and GlcNAc transferase